MTSFRHVIHRHVKIEQNCINIVSYVHMQELGNEVKYSYIQNIVSKTELKYLDTYFSKSMIALALFLEINDSTSFPRS